MLKSEARKLYKQKRCSLSAIETTKLDDLLLIQFQTLQLPFIKCLFSFWPIDEDNEPNTQLFIEFLKFRNPELKILYPKSDFRTNSMHAVSVDADTPFEKKGYNIYEPDSNEMIPPEEIDLAFVPMFICDKQGIRVGYGKGFYDKYLKNCRPQCLKVGLSYFDPVEKIDDANEFDVPLNLCVTPQNIYVF